jgi:hypothetical protein
MGLRAPASCARRGRITSQVGTHQVFLAAACPLCVAGLVSHALTFTSSTPICLQLRTPSLRPSRRSLRRPSRPSPQPSPRPRAAQGLPAARTRSRASSAELGLQRGPTLRFTLLIHCLGGRGGEERRGDGGFMHGRTHATIKKSMKGGYCT